MRLQEFLAQPISSLPSGYTQQKSFTGKTIQVPFHFQEHFQDTEGVALYTSFLWKNAAPRVFLSLSYCFYISRVFLNQKFLGQKEGYFYPHLYELTQSLKRENELLIEILCQKERELHAKKQILGVFGHWDCKQPSLQAGGIAGAVELITRPSALLRRALFLSRKNKKGYHLHLHIVTDSLEAREGTLTLLLKPANFQGKTFSWKTSLPLAQGISFHRFSLFLPRVQEWFPYELGFPHLYEATLFLKTSEGEDKMIKKIGFRTVEEKNHRIFLNRIPLYLRGSNMAPLSFHLKEVTEARYEALLKKVKEANLNVLRIHAHIEKKEFYDLADREGLLLFQDFPLQWGYDKAIEKQARRQVRKMFFMLHTHPSIYLFCCHNEPFPVPATDPEDVPLPVVAKTLFSVFVFNSNKDILDYKLEKTLKKFHSPHLILRGSGLFRTPFHAPTDAHIYCGWYQGKKEHLPLFLFFFPYFKHFITEFGAQAFPDLTSLEKWGIADKDLPFLKKHYLLQPSLMKKYVTLQGKPLHEIIPLSQNYQAEVIRYYIEHYRLMKYAPNRGYIHFILNDGCPGITWSVLDVEGTPKKGYETLKQCSAPTYPILKWKKSKNRLKGKWVIAHDQHQFLRGVKGEFLVQSKNTKKRKIFFFDLPPDSLYPLPPFTLALPDNHLTLSFYLWHNGKILGKNHYSFGGKNGIT